MIPSSWPDCRSPPRRRVYDSDHHQHRHQHLDIEKTPKAMAMARISDVRSSIIPEVPLINAEMVKDDEDDGTFDDEDFWEALDLMETSYKMIIKMMKRLRMAPETKHLLEHHADDLKQFIDQFEVFGD